MKTAPWVASPSTDSPPPPETAAETFGVWSFPLSDVDVKFPGALCSAGSCPRKNTGSQESPEAPGNHADRRRTDAHLSVHIEPGMRQGLHQLDARGGQKLRRIGLEAVSDFQAKIVPLLEIVWVDAEWRARALRRLFTVGRKDVSLVDCLSFEVMAARNLQTAFAFDKHFEETGFTLAAFHDLDAVRRGCARPSHDSNVPRARKPNAGRLLDTPPCVGRQNCTATNCMLTPPPGSSWGAGG